VAKNYLPGSRLDVRIRRTKIAKALIEGKSQEEALRAAGYREKTIERDCSKIIKKAMPVIQSILLKAGIDEDFLAQQTRALYDAKQYSPVTLKNPDGSTELHTWEARDDRVRQRHHEHVTEMAGLRRWGLPGQVQGQQLVQVNVSFGGVPGGAATASQTALPVQVRVLNPGQPESEPGQDTEADTEADSPAPEEGP